METFSPSPPGPRKDVTKEFYNRYRTMLFRPERNQQSNVNEVYMNLKQFDAICKLSEQSARSQMVLRKQMEANRKIDDKYASPRGLIQRENMNEEKNSKEQHHQASEQHTPRLQTHETERFDTEERTWSVPRGVVTGRFRPGDKLFRLMYDKLTEFQYNAHLRFIGDRSPEPRKERKVRLPEISSPMRQAAQAPKSEVYKKFINTSNQDSSLSQRSPRNENNLSYSEQLKGRGGKLRSLSPGLGKSRFNN
eukprot:TRINITY_DN6444_c0_g2_i3.p1 TRINITY_DN6444_c0_g2~~TRINITY_DN6444_c0_g2_i3.p1  ORF type:complete len:250 (+),score=19.98 TRINITY_DN6444_c0_g2_i3:83-832(+)